MNYEINKDTLVILPVDENSSKIIERESEYLINDSAFKVLEHSCEYFGSSYNGRHSGTKSLINITHKSPIVIEESTKLIFFPTTSPNRKDCIWISLNNILNYMPGENKDTSIIEFINGSKLKLNISIGVLNNQILRATRLHLILTERINQKM